MDDQNSVIERQIRPDDLMEELSIKKDTYYDDLKFLGVKAEKDNEGKAYLTEAQANLIRELRSWVNETGKRDGFPIRNGAMVKAESTTLLDDCTPSTADGDCPDLDLENLIHAAAELKGHQLALPDLVKLELADRMTYDDLPDEVKQKVDRIRDAANPKSQPAQLAETLLAQWRKRQQVA